MSESTLFDMTPIGDTRTAAPHNGTPTSTAGARHIAPEASGLRSIVASALHAAGVPTRGGSEGGCTIQELAAIATKRRGKHTKETSITGRLDELVRTGYAVKTNLTRMGNAGVRVGIWVHRMHYASWMCKGESK